MQIELNPFETEFVNTSFVNILDALKQMPKEKARDDAINIVQGILNKLKR